MTKKTKLSIILRCAGVFFLVLAVVFLFLSFNVRRGMQEVFGFSSIALFPMGGYSLFVGDLFKKDRNKRSIFGRIFLATGVTLFYLGALVAFGILIASFAFGTKPIWIYIYYVFLFSGIVFISVGSILIS